MPQSNELRVFISSTFRDLQEEREHLMKKIFPEIRALCRERGITFMEVDLRWGLTHEDKVQGQVLRTCLAEIDRCRPYFIGVTGNRYGYVLEPHELYKDGELLSRYQWVEDAALEGSSMIDFRELAAYFQRQVDEADDGSSANVESSLFPLRLARELIHALEKFGDDMELAKALSTVSVLLVLWKENESEVLELWQRLTDRGHDPIPLYGASLEQLRNDGSSLLPDALFSTASFHRSRSTYNDETRTMIAHSGLGEVHNFQGDYDLSLSHSTEALRLAETLDDTHRIATALRNLGWVHMLQGRYDEAMARSLETLKLAKSIGNKLEISWALNSIGSLHRLYNQIPEARVCFERSLLVAESGGDKSGVDRRPHIDLSLPALENR